MASLLNTLLGVVALICAIWVIYDVFTNNKKLKVEIKILWTIAAILFSILTAIVYFIVYKMKK
ncbi:MAG TPA: PLDc N-terminal domain-containing protein [archaeon]|jgi:CDP-diglyceride synthetase|nr:PLDc N-terminal domain-containing protein [archaeon]HPV66559.1 PLDc N-terminal domain-containing protein [archaeon]